MKQEHSKAAFAAYRISAGSATGVTRTIMLYDKVSMLLADARSKWQASIFDGAFAAMKEAAAVLAELSATLDESKGRAVCEALRRYYTSLAFQVLALPRQPDPAARIDSLLRQIAVVREAWAEVMAQQPHRPQQPSGSTHDSVSLGLA